MAWTIKTIGNPDIKAPILITGLPGIGNVSKIAVDFMIAELKAKKVAELESYYLPNSVFVNEKSLVELPSINLYHKKIKGKELLFLAGDAQPIDEPSTYELCDAVLDYVQEKGGKEIISLAGIGLQGEPESPKVYCTGNNKKIVAAYKKGLKVSTQVVGFVGPIMGVSGLMAGLAAKRKIDAVVFLAETFAHPLYVGIKGAKEVVKILNTKFKLGISITKLDKDIRELEDSVKIKTEDMEKISKMLKPLKAKEMNYIG